MNKSELIEAIAASADIPKAAATIRPVQWIDDVLAVALVPIDDEESAALPGGDTSYSPNAVASTH